MTEETALKMLKFTDAWLDIGIVDEKRVEHIAAEFRFADDQHAEHYRYCEFRAFLEQQQPLDHSVARSLFDLGAREPDLSMGMAMMLDILRRDDCPWVLYELARYEERVAGYVDGFLSRREKRSGDSA